MRPVDAERVRGKIAVALPAVEMRDAALVTADRKICTRLVTAAVGTVVAVDVHPGLQPQEGVVKVRTAGGPEHTQAVALLHPVDPDHATPADLAVLRITTQPLV